jgi:hypothetical protein
MSDVTFRTKDINRSRYLWHPSVHRHYKESCRYILLRFPEPEVGSVVAKLESTMEKALIESYNVYLVYGFYDILIRAWATPQQWDRLSHLLGLTFQIDSHNEYHVDEVEYLWTKHPNQDPPVRKFTKLIEDVSRKERDHEDLTEDDRSLSELVGAGLLHLLQMDPAPAIKFFVLLTRPPYLASAKREYDDLRRMLTDDIPFIKKIKQPSIYRVNRGREYFLKFVVNDYSEILTTIKYITDATRGFNLRTMTLLVSNNDAPEADVVDPQWEEFPRDLVTLEELLRDVSSSVAKHLAGLDAQTRLDVATAFRRHQDLKDEPLFRPLFEGFFLARAEQDIQMLSEKMIWISHLESLLRTYLREVAQAAMESDWFKVVTAKAAAIKVPQAERPEKYTLLDTVSVLAKLSKEGDLGELDLEKDLGTDWEDHIRGLVTEFAGGLHIRNSLAHGDFYDQEDAYWENWPAIADRVLNAATIYVRLLKRSGWGDGAAR